MQSQWGTWMMCISTLMSLLLDIFPQAALISQPQVVLQPAEWTDWDLALRVEEACARTERATPWTLPTGAPLLVTRPQRRPNLQIHWTLARVALKGAMLSLYLPHTTLWLIARDTPAHSPPSSGHTVTLCTYAGTTRGHTGEMRGWLWVRVCPPEPAASSSCLHSCSTAHCLTTLLALPEKKTWAGSVISPHQTSPSLRKA